MNYTTTNLKPMLESSLTLNRRPQLKKKIIHLLPTLQEKELQNLGQILQGEKEKEYDLLTELNRKAKNLLTRAKLVNLDGVETLDRYQDLDFAERLAQTYIQEDRLLTT